MPAARPARVAAALAVASLWLWVPASATAAVPAAAYSDGPVATSPAPSVTPPSPPQVMLDETEVSTRYQPTKRY
ncbi:Protein of unknown function [Gryllus bimaculatus]|nr:Protein of unknown function [Gryllus bimaculatus]